MAGTINNEAATRIAAATATSCHRTRLIQVEETSSNMPTLGRPAGVLAGDGGRLLWLRHVGGHEATSAPCEPGRRIEVLAANLEEFHPAAQHGQIVPQLGIASQMLFNQLAFRVVQGTQQVSQQILSGGISPLSELSV